MNARVSSRHNPFASAAIERVPFRFATGDWPSQLERLQTLRYHAAIVGPKGTGKTTLLEQLHQRLQRTHPVYLLRIPRQEHNYARSVSTLIEKKRRDTVLLLDSFEQLPVSQRIRMQCQSRDRGGLIVTCHRRGFLPVWIRCEGTVDSLRHVLNWLTRRLDQHVALQILECGLAELPLRGGNVRQVLRCLYDRVAEGAFGTTPFVSDGKLVA